MLKKQRTMVFLKRGITVPENSRCCSDHMYRSQLTQEALEMIEPSKIDYLVLTGPDVQSLISDFRSTIAHVKSFDFDNPNSLDNEAYKAITGVTRGR